ncbi:DUF2478 domain-containing protein [Paracoccus sp. S3-43]|uniref:DUF2478 domain-containing protein n=1 Tax=Paracoccus sp. S3-43 TaxID=3030011 RepID=UPI0023AECE14|nr:DUF2478 domain-containing protein [Paracoccus sp. S3-43]WEF25583.1 DUF2478 domain-containing protein [Paracoccus sp. S3-43]
MIGGFMDIRYLCSDEEKRTDAVLCAVADALAAEGIRLAGTLQPPEARHPGEQCHIVLALLPDRELRDVSVPLSPEVTGCRLDPGALEQAVMVVQGRVAGAQALIVNKFGKQEAAGRGLVPAIGEACERGIPVLVGVSPQWRDAFLAFADGRAQELPADEARILSWLRQSCRQAAL